MRIVPDTNVLISATFWKGPSNEITLLAAKRKISCFTSIEIIDEYGKILKRDFAQKEEQIEEKIKGILMFSQVVNPDRELTVVNKDPEDNKIIEAALAAKADYLVSGDRHLLELKQFRGIGIIKPREFLNLLK